MPERDGYIPGVPCWVDTSQPDPEAAVGFYSGLFGWEFEDVMAPDAPGKYFVARIRGGTVGAVGSQPEGSGPEARWDTYIWVDSADETASKVLNAGGKVLMDPFDVMNFGRMALFADPSGAAFCVWQAKDHKGARIVNEHGAVDFNGLNTRDPEGAKAFYGSVFGWEILVLPGGFEMWTLPGYGDYLERDDPGLRERVAEIGAPEGFEDVVASINPIAGGRPEVSPHWDVTFAADDADAIAEKAAELGGRVIVAPFDVPWSAPGSGSPPPSRTTVIADPQGATFTASQFVPEINDPAAGP
jgi:predicted enzyme related to lactoylglutathione lyase